MSKQYPGGIISKNPVVPSGPYSNDTASGIWTLDQQAYWQKLGQWPTAGNFPIDPQFNYVTMLLHGDGTNGAQNNTFLDSSTNNFTITRNGNTTQGSFGPYGDNWSNYFDGSSSFSLSNNTALDMGTGDFTLEFWVFSTDASIDSQYRRFVVTGTNSTSAIQVGHIGATSGVVAYTADDASLTITGTTNVLNTWAHIAVVRQSGTVKLYVNGTSEGTPITDNNSKTTSNFNIGRYPALDGYLKGNISNIRLVKGTAVYTSNFTPSTTPLTAISGTSLLTCQSNRFIDNSANAFTLTTNGTPSVQRFNPFGASTAYSTSVIGGSGYFDGSGDYLGIATNSALQFGTGDFTFECWIYPNGVAGNEFIADFGASSASGWGLYDEGSGGNMQFRIADTDRIAVNPLVARAWSHVAVVRSGTTATLYVNGTSVGSYGSAGTNLTYSGTNYIGSQSGSSNYMNGYMSNVRAVKGTAVYTANFTPSTSPLTAISGTSLLLSTTNGAIFDNAMMNDLETVGNAQISTSVVKYGTGSMYFDGTGDYLYSAKFVPFGTGNFTIECWVYPLTTAERPIFYQFPYESYGIGFGINGPSAGKLYFYSQSLISSSTAPVVTGAWQHIACVKSGGTITLYYNGTSVASGAFNQNHIVTNMYIAADPQQSGIYYNGYVDDIRITNGYARYTTNFTPPTAAFPDIGPT